VSEECVVDVDLGARRRAMIQLNGRRLNFSLCVRERASDRVPVTLSGMRITVICTNKSANNMQIKSSKSVGLVHTAFNKGHCFNI
jgi:hypothetical protein